MVMTAAGGQELGTSKLLGDQTPTVMIARPDHDGGAGSIKVMPHNNMQNVVNF
ncbi:MAG: hypothetical protein QM765_44525 [Myxococcales bacterium]